MAAFVGADERETLLGDRAHGGDIGRVLHAQHWADMQAADRGMGVPGALGVVAGEHLVQAFRVVGEVGQIDGAILDEGDRLSVALHRHHDVQSGLAHLGDVGLEPGIGGAHDHAGKAEIAHHRVEVDEFGQQGRVFMAMELDDQHAVGLADEHAVDGGAVDRNGAAQLDHRAIDEFDGLGVERDQMLGGGHGGAEIGELADAEDFAGFDRVQHQFERCRERQRALGADEQAGEVVAAGGPCGRRQGVDVVATDAA